MTNELRGEMRPDEFELARELTDEERGVPCFVRHEDAAGASGSPSRLSTACSFARSTARRRGSRHSPRLPTTRRRSWSVSATRMSLARVLQSSEG